MNSLNCMLQWLRNFVVADVANDLTGQKSVIVFRKV